MVGAKSDPVLESNECKILWDLTIQCDSIFEDCRKDIIVEIKVMKETITVDLAVLRDVRVKSKENEKSDHRKMK